MNAWSRSPAESAFSGDVMPFHGPRFRYQVTEVRSSWAAAVVERLNELCALPRGWNGYDGLPVSFSVAQFTLSTLNAIMWDDAPIPSIIPCGSGDLQVEWHLISGDIELHVMGPNEVSAFYEPAGDSGNAIEMEVKADFTAIAGWLRELGEKRRAIITAAA